MRKFLMFMLAALLVGLSGCGGIMYQTWPDGSTKRVLAPQVGANVQILDLCGEDAGILYGTHGYLVEGMNTLPGRHLWVALPTMNGVRERSVALTYVAVHKGKHIGSVSQSFPVYYENGSQRFQWVLTPNGSWSGGGQNVYIDRCPQLERRE